MHGDNGANFPSNLKIPAYQKKLPGGREGDSKVLQSERSQRKFSRRDNLKRKSLCSDSCQSKSLRFSVYGNVSGAFGCPKSHLEIIAVEALERLICTIKKIHIRATIHDFDTLMGA